MPKLGFLKRKGQGSRQYANMQRRGRGWPREMDNKKREKYAFVSAKLAYDAKGFPQI